MKYHPSDFLFGCTYPVFVDIWCKQHYSNGIAEICIFKNFILNYLQTNCIDINKFETHCEMYGNIMSQIFNIYNTHYLKPYIWKNHQFSNTVDKTTTDFFKYGCNN